MTHSLSRLLYPTRAKKTLQSRRDTASNLPRARTVELFVVRGPEKGGGVGKAGVGAGRHMPSCVELAVSEALSRDRPGAKHAVAVGQRRNRGTTSSGLTELRSIRDILYSDSFQGVLTA